MDLRQPWPFVPTFQLPGKHDSDYAQQYPDHIASTSILGLRIHYISLAGPQYGRFVFGQMSYWDRTKGLFHVATSPITGPQHWQKTISTKMFRDRMTVPEIIIDHSFPQIKAIFQVLADPSSYPVLILNKYGSDYVSMVIDLVLLLLRTDTQSMHRDYMQTYEDLAGLKEERLELSRTQGIPDDFVEPFLPFVNTIERHMETKHGGIEQYLLSVGLSLSELRALNDMLSSDSSMAEKQGLLVDL
jgi:protein-tyrosine phosphatase